MAASVKSVSRILYIIQFLNQENGVTTNQMAMATQFSRATTYRMLETLRSLGFVRKEPDGRYWLEPQILSLSSGYCDDDDLTECLRSILKEFGDRVRWPLSVSTRAGNSMVIRASTDLDSPTAARRRLTAGWPMPGLLNSAAGTIVLAFSDRATRAGLFDLIANEEEDLLANDSRRQEVETVLDKAAEDGFVIVTHAITWNWIDRTSAVALPVFRNNRLYGALSMRYFHKKVSADDIKQKFVGVLHQAAEKIGSSLPRPTRE